ncbi:MAG: hypothetical protein KDA88_02535 [Planctomycetaceae bacterium]|nr:hypothetical protein [Planctomycetaceae bacterium]MCB9952120.1 hypothetical protein [Planctomycetaceae bacterium]
MTSSETTAEPRTGHFSVDNSQCRMVGRVDRIDDAALKIEYSLANQSGLHAFVFHGVSRGPEAEFDPNLTYVIPVNREIELAKKMLPVPKGLRVERPVIPLCIRIEPGESFSDSIQIPMPLVPWSHYSTGQSDDIAKQNEMSERVNAHFVLGFFLAPTESVQLATPIQLADREYWSFKTFDPQKQLFFRVGPIADVPVRFK